jgi:hypothetical protein
VSVSPEQRARLLRELHGGADLELAADCAGVPLAEVRDDALLLVECRDTFRLATSRMRSLMAAKALNGKSIGDAALVEREVDRRDRVAREAFSGPPAAGGVNGRDLDFSALSDVELEIVECALNGNFGRLNQLITVRAHTHIDRMRAELLREIERSAEVGDRPAPAGVRPPAPAPAPSRPRRPDMLEVADPGEPLPARRALTVSPPPPPPLRGVAPPKALAPGSPWANSDDEYPL